MQAITHNFIVWESPHGKLMAERFHAEFAAKRQEMYDALSDTPDHGIVKSMIDIQIHKGLDIRHYQKRILETFDYYSKHAFDDDLLEQLIQGTEPPDIHDIIEILKEFSEFGEADKEVVSIIPLDISGCIGFVVRNKRK